MRYHVLKAGVTIRNVIVCMALAAASYLASGLVNAAPVTQPRLTGLRSRGVIVTSPPTTIGTPEDAPAGPLGESLHIAGKGTHAL